jgi:hypothetical protein
VQSSIGPGEDAPIIPQNHAVGVLARLLLIVEQSLCCVALQWGKSEYALWIVPYYKLHRLAAQVAHSIEEYDRIASIHS